MKKLLNNPKILIIISIILLSISSTMSFISFFNIFTVLDFIISGRLILLLYCVLIISKKHINLTIMNTVVFINLLIECLRIGYLSVKYTNDDINLLINILFVNYVPLFVVLIIGLGIIFYSKNKRIIKPNIMCIISIIIYIICYVMNLINIYALLSITELDTIRLSATIQAIVGTIYYIPVILYFRLYGLNRLRSLGGKK